MSYYSQVETWTNAYALQLGLGGSYGHRFNNVMIQELVNFDGVLVKDGVKGGSDGAIYRRWQNSEDMDQAIIDSMSYRRFLQIKRTLKLCDNRACPKRGEDGYDPAYKFDYIWKCLVHNVNAVSKKAELDLCGDETTYATGAFGEKGAGIVGQIANKPGITKGGQIVLVSDVHRIRPRAYLHRHKLHKDDEFSIMAQVEVRKIVDKLDKMVVGAEGDQPKLFDSKPHTTWDNYFSGDKIFDYVGKLGQGMIMTCRRDRLPTEIDGKFLHKKKTDSSHKTKVARFFEPVIAVKEVAPGERDEWKKYERVHVSFQSTSSCNFSLVNSLNHCELTREQRERGRGKSKRKWFIEMNAARRYYLSTYGRIDSIDHLINNCKIFYWSWKYWHSPMNHAKALAVLTAYDIYLEVTDGEIEPAWKVKDKLKLDFWSFRAKLSNQLLAYHPTKRQYRGDDRFRLSTQQNQEQREAVRAVVIGEACVHATTSPAKRGRKNKLDVEAVNFEQEFKRQKRGASTRLCGDLTKLRTHINSLEIGLKHPNLCAVCGTNAYSKCTLCNKYVHYNVTRGADKGKNCFFELHDDSMFGLARDDFQLTNTKKGDWTKPSAQKMRKNKDLIDKFSQDKED